MRTQIFNKRYFDKTDSCPSRTAIHVNPAIKLAVMFLFVVVLMLVFLRVAERTASAQAPEALRWEQDFNNACRFAQNENRLVLVHFYSDCAPCSSMNASVFTDPRVAQEMNRNFAAVRVNIRANTNTQSDLAKQYDISVVPTDLILNNEGKVVYKRQGEIAAEKYLQFLQYLKNNFAQPQANQNQFPFANQPEQKQNEPVPNNIHPSHVIAASGQADPAKTIPATIPVTPANPVEKTVPPTNDYFTNHQNTSPNNNHIEFKTTDNIRIDEGALSNVVRVDDAAGRVVSGGVVLDNSAAGSMAGGAVLGGGFVGGVVEGVGVGHLTVEVPLAIEGYCPVVLCRKELWVPGNPAYYAMYRGQVYRFSSQEAMIEFLKSPLKFAPVAMGEDVVMMIDRNKKVCGFRKYGVWFGGRVYLFSSQESLDSFCKKPEYYANIAQNYEAAFKSPLDTVQR
ncbi:MAG: thioredoxin family protein [Planctomycetaceae bacterium]|jgi:thioredoxin-related protein/YHS domain-containing protein|nr:thioredoxin family protein [Planctomycetaceae bacterium]